MGKYISFLRETDLFYNLSPLQLEMVDSISEEKAFREGKSSLPRIPTRKNCTLSFVVR